MKNKRCKWAMQGQRGKNRKRKYYQLKNSRLGSCLLCYLLEKAWIVTQRHRTQLSLPVTVMAYSIPGCVPLCQYDLLSAAWTGLLMSHCPYVDPWLFFSIKLNKEMKKQFEKDLNYDGGANSIPCLEKQALKWVLIKEQQMTPHRLLVLRSMTRMKGLVVQVSAGILSKCCVL